MAGRLPALLIVGLLSCVTLWGALPAKISRPVQLSDAAMAPLRHAVLVANVEMPFIAADAGTSHIEAIRRFSVNAEQDPLMSAVFPRLAELTAGAIGPKLDPEAILARHFDAIFIWSGDDAALGAVRTPNVIELPEDGADTLELWLRMGTLTGHESRTSALAERYRSKLAALRPLTEAGAVRPSIMQLVGGREYGYWIGSAVNRNNSRFRAVGAEVIAGPKNGDADFEFILRADPEVIFLDPSGTGDALLPKDLYGNPQWRSLRAVRSRRVYQMPTLPLFALPVEDPIRWQWLAEILHPDRVPPSMRAEVRETLQLAYHYTPTDADLDRLLRLQENAESAGYGRFARAAGAAR